MIAWLRELDRVLRGDATKPAELADGRLGVSGRRLAVVSLLLGVIYGLCMGFFAVFNRDEPEWRQPIATMLKIPALFGLTLLVTFPSLYVFNALIGSRLTPLTLARLLTATLGVITAVLASFGPIIAFFSVTTPSYAFILLLNVAMFAVSGLLGMNFLFRTLSRLVYAIEFPRETATPSEEQPAPTVLAVRRVESRIQSVFSCWALVFGLVGMQMSWVLRPFLGAPNMPFTWFRPRTSSFFEAVINSIRALFS